VSPSGSGRRPVQRLLAEARPYRSHLVATSLLGLLATPLTLLVPLPLKIAIDSGLNGHPLPHLLQMLPADLHSSRTAVLILAAALHVSVILLLQLQSMAYSVLSTSTGEKLTLAFRGRLFRHIQRMSPAYHDSQGTADSIYRVQYDAPCIREILVDGLIPFISASLTVAGMVYVTVRIDWMLASVAFGVAPFLYLSARSYRRWTKPRYLEAKGLESRALHVVQEVFASLRVVKAFGREDAEEGRFVETADAGVRARIRLVLFEGLFSLVVNLIIALGTAAVLVLGISHVRSGTLTLGTLLVVVSYLGQLYSPLKTASKKVADLQASFAGAERAFDVLDRFPEVPERPIARRLSRARGEIVFRDVTFAYDGGDPILYRVGFAIEAGTGLCLIGESGEGKTTLVNLLARFYDPVEGQILLDGEDLRDYSLGDLRNQFAFVLQDPILFSTSIAENIAYARPDATREEIVAAARAAGADGFISRSPEGYATLVGERGMRLSGGERQRIALARAFLKDAPILVLDEPTSSVGVRIEGTILRAVERLMAGRTTILISHRSDPPEKFGACIRLAGAGIASSTGVTVLSPGGLRVPDPRIEGLQSGGRAHPAPNLVQYADAKDGAE
jgi:ATP-binding cassette subfamily B protein